MRLHEKRNTIQGILADGDACNVGKEEDREEIRDFLLHSVKVADGMLIQWIIFIEPKAQGLVDMECDFGGFLAQEKKDVFFDGHR